MSSGDEWALQFEHIDWEDIVEAELSGDAEALQGLRDKSLELKRSFSCPSPSAPPMACSPIQPQPQSFKVPQKQPSRKSKGRRRPPHHRDYHRDTNISDVNAYPTLPRRNTLPSLMSIPTSPSGVSYAQAVQPQLLAKRTTSDRLCLSPIDCQPKRNNTRTTEVMSTPDGSCDILAGSCDMMEPCNGSTPHNEMTTTAMTEEVMDFATPDTDSRPSKAVTAVQRRLFPVTKENTSPKSSSKSLSDKQVQELTDHRLTQRERQINFGKNTLGYQRYIQTLPKWQRGRADPMTPDKYKWCSTRSWQGQMRVWRRTLHKYDPPNEQGHTQFTTEQAELCDLDI